jgi:ATP-dependent helicase IRC3
MKMKNIDYQALVTEIISDIRKNKFGFTFRKYETFFSRIGMLKRRNLDGLIFLEDILKKSSVTFWKGKNQANSLIEFKKGTSITFRITDEIIQPEDSEAVINYAAKVNVSDSESGINLFPHQEEAYYNLQKEIIKSNKNPFSGMLVLPTGGGKTLTAAIWISKNILDKNKKVLWIAHRHELLEQAKYTFVNKLAFKDVFANRKSFNYRILSGIHDKPINVRSSDDIIISSKDSLTAGFDIIKNSWFKSCDGEIFLVIDEAHHSSAKSYRKLIENVKSTVSTFRLLGLTATPTRTLESEKGFLAKIYPDGIVYNINLRTLIRLGILSEPVFEEVSTGQNFIKELNDEQIAKISYFDIDSIGDKIAKTIAENDERNLLIVNKYVTNKEKYKQTLVFALNVDNAIALNALFKEKGIKSEYVIANVKDAVTGVTTNFTKENKEKIERFRNGKTEVLINVNILTEGTDVPNIQSVFLTRPTISTILMTQMVGRGLRGLKAGGTKEAYIVSFIDDWQNKIAWVNPEKLFIEENVDFDDKEYETKKHLLRLVAINKIEEFAILTNQKIEPVIKLELEKLDFIQRIPKGIYQFSYLQNTNNEPIENNCEILVYDNIEQSYTDLIQSIPYFFSLNRLNKKEGLSEKEMDKYSKILEDEFFIGTEMCPAYRIEDIKDLLQYYSIKEELPKFIPFTEREKYDIDKIAIEICDKDLGPNKEKELIDKIWEDQDIAWQTFFNYDKRHLIREISLAKSRILFPDQYSKEVFKPLEEYEIRKYERMSLYDIRQVNPAYEKWLRDEVYKKYTDKDGYYYSALSGYRSKNRLVFQVDHINPMHKGGLTVLENLRLLTKKENGEKGAS